MEENTIWQYSLIDTASGLVEYSNRKGKWRGIECYVEGAMMIDWLINSLSTPTA